MILAPSVPARVGPDVPGEVSTERVEGLATRRLILALAVVLGVAVAARLALGGGRGFAVTHDTKAVTLPVVYLVFAFAAFLPVASRRGVRAPGWLTFLVVGMVLGLAGSLFAPEIRTTPLALAQGTALLGGFVLFGWFGMQAAHWPEALQERLFNLLIVAGLIVGALGALSLTGFGSVAVPTFFAVVILALRSPVHRIRYIVLAVPLGVLMVINLRPYADVAVSGAVIGQVVICAGVTAVLVVVPKRMRVGIVVLASCAAVYLFQQGHGLELVSGQYVSDDVTLAHRSYEAGQVLHLIAAHPWGMFFGFGPGATVDLTNSPDAATLLSSGRDLTAVDDVHLMSGYLLLKMGALGLAWFCMLVGAMWRISLSCIRAKDDLTTFRAVLLVYVLAGVVLALPAATHLFTNPIVPLFLGVLWATTPGAGRRQT
jgi:hypothetical protein